MPSSLAEIRNYYERNTRLFLRFGASQQVRSIHRALWPPGVKTLEAALNVSNEMVLEQARHLHAAAIADLGCGVGATLFFLLSRLPPPISGVGITVSHLQAQLAAQQIAPPTTHILEADFQALPLAPGFDLLYSIEAFVHAAQPQVYLSEAARILRPGGRLVLLDDFAASKQGTAAWRQLYQWGWYAPNLNPPAEVERLAKIQGLRLIETRNLTPLLRLRAWPNSLAAGLAWFLKPLWRWHPIVPSMLGSLALQQCLRDGTIEYRWLVFEKK